MDRAELERLDRESLVLRAQAAGIRRARVLTRPELIDELVRLDPVLDDRQLKRTRGFFGLARDLLSRVVERGLHLPDAADRLRAALGDLPPEVPRPEPQAIPTVTLAEIYAAQGHKTRAVDTLKRVLEAEPDHAAARALLEKLEDAAYVTPPPPALPPEVDPPPPPASSARSIADEELREELREEEEDQVDELAPETPDPETTFYRPRPATVGAEKALTDECVAIPTRFGSYVWWRLAAPVASFVVRVVIVVPTWNGPRVTIRDFAVDPADGGLVLRDLPRNAVVRVAVGSMVGDTFVPRAHSPAIEATDTHELVHWTPEGRHPVVLDEPRSAAIAAAAAAAAERAARIEA